MKVEVCKCGKEFATHKKTARYCSNKCKYLFRIRPSGLKYRIASQNKTWFKKGSQPWNMGKALTFQVWNKGRGAGYLNYFGYKVLCKNGVEVLEHRKVMQDYLGRELLPTEIVHHIDHNKTNNNIDNLALLSRSEHAKLHNEERL